LVGLYFRRLFNKRTFFHRTFTVWNFRTFFAGNFFPRTFLAVTGQIDPPRIFWFSSTPAEIGLRRRFLFFSLFVMSHFYTKIIWTCFLCFHFQTITFKTDLRIMIPPGRISDRVIVYSGCTTRSLKFQMPPLLLISRW